MSATEFLEICVAISLALLVLSFALITIRIVRGPTFADRVLALDMLVSVGIGFIAVIGVKTGFYLYIDIAIALGLVGFLATVAFARYVMHCGDVLGGESAMCYGSDSEKQR
ncbi:multicomponent Na+:H+ antiporter subunit F [Rhodopseudomonas julia]|uniref:Multicomponent Na+:H+ antiporter subunit F n=1 Tax=Rhodopseudomonas julia TaxID=200617 RepID=A0ABU0C652_9BRAD|nr:cation:proton antiporter [Rhodopseudomonas julia]MDQ0324562.1 multicomponent Na+:H+ antiporter subunit F [Rhodopseudomonas julia]